MPVPASPSQHPPAGAPRTSFAARAAVLVVTAAAGGAALALAPSGATPWTLAVVLAGWACVAVTVLVDHRVVRKARATAVERESEVGRLRAEAARRSAEISHLAGATLPAVAERLREGASAADVLAAVPPPSDPQLSRITHTFAATVEEDVRRVMTIEDEYRAIREELDQAATEHDRFVRETMPAAISRLREGRSAATVLAETDLPHHPALRVPAESFIRELALSERRAAAAQAASAKALSRVQAKAVQMLADLRDMQERHGEEVFGDLLKLDHSTSQLGLMTDRLALLMGGRSSRAWNKPIKMESILRGAAGRIAAYQRVRLHCSTRTAVAGFAAEGVMHLLAELMDNAANFSPPIDEVHVYVEDRSAGIVVTIEDSGLKMADAAMRRAEEAVTGRVTDLASLQGTRLGLAVVGRLAAKYGVSVNYRPSSRGGTGVVVLLPLHLLAQHREPAPHETTGRGESLAGRGGAARGVPVQSPSASRTSSLPARDADALPSAGSAVGSRSDVDALPVRGARDVGTLPVRGSNGSGGDRDNAAGARPAAAHLPATPESPAPRTERQAAITERLAELPTVPGQGRHRQPDSTTPNGLPVRAPGRTMAEAEREREQRQSAAARSGDTGSARRGARDAGSRFGAFHRGARQSGNGGTGASGIGAPGNGTPGNGTSGDGISGAGSPPPAAP
ncbi:ATP-binding protein [Streptomyces sp. DSM 41972]|uniref:histidine kinase n=1 Tax=Streptomyces althioticus subsp. attaecolombicae TaxID=3075534 RepID=A0ABU3I327_9ACTN|nr:ATP-binding protein [Streptomyces sp. DSM 41972]SCD28968.1 Signal transduction histidine kinase [Streptomyces sp. di50b]SCD90803.1 Signal transduction histidine kinase [Streptomyces sp. di188]